MPAAEPRHNLGLFHPSHRVFDDAGKSGDRSDRLHDPEHDPGRDPGALVKRGRRGEVTEKGAAKALGTTELTPTEGANISAQPDFIPGHLRLDPREPALVDYDVYESIYNPGKMLLLTGWKTATDAQAWKPATFAGVSQQRHRCMRNIREYGMFDRAEATQYYPDAIRH